MPGDGPRTAAEWPRPARLSVGVIAAGRVGTALGAALERAGHVVGACAAVSDASRERARTRLPESRILPADEVAASSELVVLAVPDTELGSLAAGLAQAVTDWSGRIVLHTSGANGVAILGPLAARGAICLAVHPAMTFTGDPADVDRLGSACFGITAPDEIAMAIAQSLVLEIGGEPVVVPEQSRTLYHAALAHGSNHLVTLVRDAAAALAAALRPRDAGAADPAGYGTITSEPGAPERILAPLLTAALDNALRHGDRALTGPVARGDTDAVAAHLRELDTVDAEIARSYRALALRTAQRSGTAPALIDMLRPAETGNAETNPERQEHHL
ncbi:Rossmann-like and DUF2520 domain-containing protein [Tomitella fengzijianii]|uniref:DUF2520 domain-containing protein n=1 Tax=Tomitella fengzijianii TaxID=2597660 RepID=A0A516X7D4_9ACTN|nr:DUF2520 domain-containing protein [Tomitella fengzijianii]QDQ98976.1 DUF2520 domain-containing protein [Tomitella fengzijianii]